MITQQDGSLGQNAEITRAEPVQRVTKGRERLRVAAYPARPSRPTGLAHPALPLPFGRDR